MKHKFAEYAELRLYIGSTKGYKGPAFSEAQLIRVVQDFQRGWEEANGRTHTVRFSKCMYVCMDYVENGWELAIINYPRHPHPIGHLNEFIDQLQDHLMIEFGQNRITVQKDTGGSRGASMSEREDAEVSHK